MKRNFLNVRSHLEHLQIVLDAYKKHGDCPLVRDEIAKLSLVNRAIMRQHDAKRARGQRHDLYVNATN